MGRPKLNIDPVVVEKLASIHCTMNEIASVVGCSVDTLENRFSEIIKTGRNKGKASLRRLQWATAEKGNAVMQIWLGKQLLDQKNSYTIEAQAGQNATLQPAPSKEVLFDIFREARSEYKQLHGAA